MDYEKINSYTLLVKAQDNGSPVLSSNTTVIINVKDINDNTPTFVDARNSITIRFVTLKNSITIRFVTLKNSITIKFVTLKESMPYLNHQMIILYVRFEPQRIL